MRNIENAHTVRITNDCGDFTVWYETDDLGAKIALQTWDLSTALDKAFTATAARITYKEHASQPAELLQVGL